LNFFGNEAWLLVQPFVCGQVPLNNEERDGAQIGCVT
jgi:hypothetical protein